MKNVLLFETNRNDLLSKLMSIEDIKLSSLMVGVESAKTDFQQLYPDLKIYSNKDIINWDSSFVSAEDIKKYKKTQLKVERFLERNDTNASKITSIYYTSLAFWINFFNTEKIDCLILTDLEHGSHMDSLPIDIAESLGIPVFIFEGSFGNGVESLKSIKCHNSNKYLKINELDCEMQKVDVGTFVNTKPVRDINDKYVIAPHYRKIVNTYLSFYLTLRKIINKIICRSTDVEAVKEEGFVKLFRIKWTISSYLGYIFKKSHKYPSTKENLYSFSGSALEKNSLELLNNCKYIKKLKKYYDKNSLKEVINGTNAILYALHFEPEATIMNRTTYNSQLYNIKMLSESLPEGWVLYVKEHPDQFRLFHPFFIVSSKNIQKYRDMNFYNEINKLRNVYLINTDVGASDMIKHDEIKAVATITGTISVECLYEHKPLIMFDAESKPYESITEIYSIKSYDDLTKAIQDISNMTKPPKYDDFENIISEYLIYEKHHTFNRIFNNDLDGTQISKKALHNLIVNADKFIK